MKKNFPFHIVTNRPWPIILSFRFINTLIRTVIWIYRSISIFIILNFINSILIIILWFRDIIRERTFQSLHTLFNINFLKFRIILFIISELIFFYFIFLNIFSFLNFAKFEFCAICAVKCCQLEKNGALRVRTTRFHQYFENDKDFSNKIIFILMN